MNWGFNFFGALFARLWTFGQRRKMGPAIDSITGCGPCGYCGPDGDSTGE